MERRPFKECICELCDCGRHKRHKNCKKQQTMAPQKNTKAWLSHYQATYIRPPIVQPRSSKRPLRTPPHPNPPPMDFRTTQRAEFLAWNPGKRTKLQAEERHYQHPQEPFQSQTLYRLHFPPPGPVPPSLHHPATQLQCHDIISQHATTSKVKGEQRPALPGEHGLATTYQPTLHSLSWEKESAYGQRMRITPDRYITKYQSDFPACRAFPAQIAPALPPLDNLKINQSFRPSFQTVQRDSYCDWDASRYPRAKLIMQKGHLRTERAEKFEVDTVSKLSYRPPGLVSPTGPIKRPATALKSLAAKFDDSTAHKFFFRDWGAQPRLRHGDPREGNCICSLGKFENQTTTHSTYLPKKADKAKSYKPEMKPIQLEGQQDFNTVHRDTYRLLPLPVCRLQTYLTQQQKMGKEADSGTTVKA